MKVPDKKETRPSVFFELVAVSGVTFGIHESVRFKCHFKPNQFNYLVRLSWNIKYRSYLFYLNITIVGLTN